MSLFDETQNNENGVAPGATPDDNGAEGQAAQDDEGANGKDPEEPEKKFSQADVDRIVADRLKRQAGQAQKLAEKQAQKTADERIADLEARIEAMTAEKEAAQMQVTVRSMLTAAKVEGVPDEVVGMLSAGTADEVEERVNALTKWITERDKQQAKGFFSGTKKPEAGGKSDGMTMEEIQKIADPLERQKLIRKYIINKK